MSDRKSFRIAFNDIPLAEFDIGGVLYHANYFRLFERAREAFLKELAQPYPELVKQKQHFGIVESSQKFILPIRYGDSVELEISTREVKKSTLVFEYQILKSGSKDLIHEAWTKAAFISVENEGFKPIAIPKDLRSKLSSYQNN